MRAVTREDFPGGGETGALIRSMDWSETPLGPVSSWPVSLKTLVRTMLHAPQPMIVWWGPELVQLYNDAMLGSMRDKHPLGMGQPGREAWKQAWATVGDELQSVVDGASVSKEDVFVPVDRNGRMEDAWWTYSYSPVFDDEGRRAGMLIICTETTPGVIARRELEKAKREADHAREELRDAFVQAPSPIALLTGPEHVFTLANPAYEELVARSVLGKPLDEAFGPEEIAIYRPIIEQVYRTGAPVEIRGAELRLPNEAGVVELRYIDAGYHPYRNADAEVTGVIVFVNDVTAVVTSRIAAEQTSRLKDEFIATVSHELRTPLTAMLGWVQLLRGDQLPESRQKHAIETIERNARIQRRLVEDLLDLGHIGSGTLRLELEALLLAPVVEAAIDAQRPAARARRVALEVALNPTLSMRGDSARLHQIVTNLLNNAIKFTDPGGQVTITLSIAEASAELIVTDTGLGIDAAFLPHVFDRFRQADAATTRVHGGLGLGLTLVKRLVEMHDGAVTAESAGRGRGATFRVKLPLEMAS